MFRETEGREGGFLRSRAVVRGLNHSPVWPFLPHFHEGGGTSQHVAAAPGKEEGRRLPCLTPPPPLCCAAVLRHHTFRGPVPCLGCPFPPSHLPGGKAQLGELEKEMVGERFGAPVFPSGTASNQKGTAQGGEAVGSPSLSLLISGCRAGT